MTPLTRGCQDNQITEKESIRVITTEQEKGSQNFNGYRISVWDHEKVLEMDSDNSCTTLQMYLMPWNCALKNGQGGKFYDVLISTHK